VAVASIGPRHALLVSAACHLTAAATVRFGLRNLPSPPTTGERVSAFRQSWTANAHLMSDRAVRRLMFVQWFPPACVTGAEALLVPYAVRRGFPQGTAGVLLACVPVGMLIGDLVVGRFLRPRTRERLVPFLLALLGAPVLALAAAPPLYAVAALLVATGAGFAYSLGLQREFLDVLPEANRGQAFGLLTTGLMTLQGLGPAAFGAFGQAASPGAAMASSKGTWSGSWPSRDNVACTFQRPAILKNDPRAWKWPRPKSCASASIVPISISAITKLRRAALISTGLPAVS